jgi:hypothetical protein
MHATPKTCKSNTHPALRSKHTARSHHEMVP